MASVTMQIWKNKRVLITGYEGFLGSHLTKTLIEHGAKVWGIDIQTHRKDTVLTPKDYRRMKVIRGSVENFSLLTKTIDENKIEFIFHLAAKSLVGDCLNKPVKAFSSNIKGTWNILEAARGRKSIQAIVIASSDKAYGSHEKLPYQEGAALCGEHPYDVSKSCADLIARTYFCTYGVPVVVTRCGNIYGPGDFNFSRIVPNVMKSILSDKTILIRSDGKFTRDYIYVDDVVNGYLLLAQKCRPLSLGGEAFNFSHEDPLSVLELVRRVCKTAQKKPDYKILNCAKHEIRHQYLASEKARKILGWRARCSCDAGLKQTVAWYKTYCR